MSRDKTDIHLWPCGDKAIAQNTGCYINVNKVDELYTEYEPMGVIHPNGKLKDMDWGIWQFSILDNNGNIIHFGEDINQE